MSANQIIMNATIANQSIDQMNEDGTFEWLMAKIDQFPIKLSFIFACAMVLGSVVPYIPQYFTIKQTQNTEGFSLYVCLTLLIANILRIMFWFGKHFETALLVQSIVMILAMFSLLELCVRVKNSNLIIQQKRRYFSDAKTFETSNNDNNNNNNNDYDHSNQCKQQPQNQLTILKKSKSFDDFNENILYFKNNYTQNNDNPDDDVNDRSKMRKNSASCIIYMMKNSIQSLNSKPNIHHKNTDIKLSDDHSTTTKIDMHNLTYQTKSLPVIITDDNNNQNQSNQNTQQNIQNQPKQQQQQQSSNTVAPQAAQVMTTTTTIQPLKQTNISKDDGNSSIQQQQPSPPSTTHNELLMIVNQNGDTQLLSSSSKISNNNENLLDPNGHLKQLLLSNESKANDMTEAMIKSTNDVDNIDIDGYKRRRFIDFDFRYFWEWTDFLSYLECMAVFTIAAGILFYLFIDVPLIVEGYGLVALVTESLLASPQFIRNLRAKSVEGMSKLMVFTWFLGDLYKTIYFFVRQAPFQFLICGCTQITFDTLIFLQIIIYKKASYRKIPKSRLKNLENRARKRFKENVHSKQMFNLLTTMSNIESQAIVVSTSIHHPQPIAKKLPQSESMEPISPKDSNSLNNENIVDDNDNEEAIIENETIEMKNSSHRSSSSPPVAMNLIELNGYENRAAVFDVRYVDDDEDDDQQDNDDHAVVENGNDGGKFEEIKLTENDSINK